MPRYIREAEFRHKRQKRTWYALTVEQTGVAGYSVVAHTWQGGEVRRNTIMRAFKPEPCLQRYRREVNIVLSYAKRVRR